MRISKNKNDWNKQGSLSTQDAALQFLLFFGILFDQEWD